MKRLIVGLLAWGIGVCAVSAVPQGGERILGMESAAVGYTATGEVEFEDPENPELTGEVALQEAALMTPLAHTEAGPVSLAGGALAGWTRLDFSGYPGLDTEDLYGVAAFLAAMQPAETGWGWSATVIPGFYSDFRSGRTGEGKVGLYGTVEYPFTSTLRGQLGVAYDTAFGDPGVYPLGGLIWQATETVSVNLLIPSPSVYWSPSDRWGVFALAQPAGDRWIINDDTAGEQVFLIESWRAGLGAEYNVWGPVWLRLAGGVDFDRRYEVRSDDNTLFDEDVDDTGYVTIALAIY